MKKVYLSLAAFSAVLLLALNAHAAQGAEIMGAGVTGLIVRQHADVAIAEKKIEIEQPASQGVKRKDSTSASIKRATVEPQKNASEKPQATDRSTQLKKEESPIENKFGIYSAIKDAIVDFFSPAKKDPPAKVDLTRIPKDTRTMRNETKRTHEEPLK